MTTRLCSFLIFAFLGRACLLSEEPSMIKRVLPPEGEALTAELSSDLEGKLNAVQKQAATLPDVPERGDALVYLKAVEWALVHGEFYSDKDGDYAAKALSEGQRRVESISRDESPWTAMRPTWVGGYQSRIDGSYQPFGLEIPEGLDLSKPSPLYVWLHGRGDKTTDLYFIRERERKRSPFAFEDGITLHPFGRHCVGYKSAGEIDVMEAIEAVSRRFSIDANRIVLLGFSMGGAGAWHLGGHYTDRWAAIHPGAGFAETARYNRLSLADYPPRYEQTLWSIYDMPNYVRNFFNRPLLAYSGENDKQMQAALVMEEALNKEGGKLQHVIGPGMGHAYHADSIQVIKSWLNDRLQEASPPREWHLQTRTLRYPRMDVWELTGLEKHYEDSRLDVELDASGRFVATTKNISSFRLANNNPKAIRIDGVDLPAALPNDFVKRAAGWHRETPPKGLRKKHGLQGPIDDAFLDPFLVVLPSGTSPHGAFQRWVEFESNHFQERWRALFRGEVRVKKDVDVVPEDLERYHVVLWGDRHSNALLAKLMDRLPALWDEQQIQVGGQKWDSAHHALAMIFPNPDAPDRYVVLNSGPTFREGHDRTNSLQNPKLPDWAVIDLAKPVTDIAPGGIAAAGFFNERWEVEEVTP